jgi:hypothetical protein
MVFTALTFYETHSKAAVFFCGRPLYATLSGSGKYKNLWNISFTEPIYFKEYNICSMTLRGDFLH